MNIQQEFLLTDVLSIIWPLTEKLRLVMPEPDSMESEALFCLHALDCATRIPLPVDFITHRMLRLIQLLTDVEFKNTIKNADRIKKEVQRAYVVFYPACDSTPLTKIPPNQHLRKAVFTQGTTIPSMQELESLHSVTFKLLRGSKKRTTDYTERAKKNPAKRTMYRLLENIVAHELPEPFIFIAMRLLVLSSKKGSRTRNKFGVFYNDYINKYYKGKDGLLSIDLECDTVKTIEALDGFFQKEINNISKVPEYNKADIFDKKQIMRLQLLYTILCYDVYLEKKGHRGSMSSHYFNTLGLNGANLAKKRSAKDLLFSIFENLDETTMLDCLRRLMNSSIGNAQSKVFFKDLYHTQLEKIGDGTIKIINLDNAQNEENIVEFSDKELELEPQLASFTACAMIGLCNINIDKTDLFNFTPDKHINLVKRILEDKVKGSDISSKAALELVWLMHTHGHFSDIKYVANQIGNENLTHGINAIKAENPTTIDRSTEVFNVVQSLLDSIKVIDKNIAPAMYDLKMQLQYGNEKSILLSLLQFIRGYKQQLMKASEDDVVKAIQLLEEYQLLIVNDSCVFLPSHIKPIVDVNKLKSLSVEKFEYEASKQDFEKLIQQIRIFLLNGESIGIKWQAQEHMTEDLSTKTWRYFKEGELESCFMSICYKSESTKNDQGQVSIATNFNICNELIPVHLLSALKDAMSDSQQKLKVTAVVDFLTVAKQDVEKTAPLSRNSKASIFSGVLSRRSKQKDNASENEQSIVSSTISKTSQILI